MSATTKWFAVCGLALLAAAVAWTLGTLFISNDPLWGFVLLLTVPMAAAGAILIVVAAVHAKADRNERSSRAPGDLTEGGPARRNRH